MCLERDNVVSEQNDPWPPVSTTVKLAKRRQGNHDWRSKGVSVGIHHLEHQPALTGVHDRNVLGYGRENSRIEFYNAKMMVDTIQTPSRPKPYFCITDSKLYSNSLEPKQPQCTTTSSPAVSFNKHWTGSVPSTNPIPKTVLWSRTVFSDSLLNERHPTYSRSLWSPWGKIPTPTST